MKATKIAEYIANNVPTFRDVEIIGPGVAYHYSRHADEIIAHGFLGAALSPNLDCTQTAVENLKATEKPGVVFGYESLEETAEEGDCCRITFPWCNPKVFQINFAAAVKAIHVQESFLEAPPTILISTEEIESFECLGLCSDLWDESAF